MKRLLLFGTPVAGMAVVALLFYANVLTYLRLTDEQEIAQLTFTRAGENAWLAYVVDGRGCAVTEVPIEGDQWRIDAEFLKWKPWANLLGLDAQYRLSRIEGRYADIDQQNRSEAPAWSLVPPTTMDIGRLGEALGRLNFLVDARYGSSVYQRIDEKLVYRVYRSQSGLITRYRPRSEDVFVSEEELQIQIRKGCDPDESLLRSAALRLEAWLQATFAG